MRALIAGQGALPGYLHRALGAGTVVCELEGFPSGLPDPTVFRIETLGTFLEDLVARGVSEVCFAGAIRRPALDPSHVDTATAPLVPRIAEALQRGDDAALREVLAMFEERGLLIRGAHELAPDLLPPPGIPTAARPSARDRQDADRAGEIHTGLAAADIGQACAVAAGQALAIEALGGTDWMLDSIGPGRRPDGPNGGVFFKAPKAGQDRRVDLPAIGVETVTGAARAGLSGLVIEAGGVLAIDLPGIVAACDAAGLFLWVRAG